MWNTIKERWRREKEVLEQVNVLGVTKQVIFAGVRTDVNELMQAIIHTELNVCIDSDDCLAIDAVEKIIKKWERVCDKGYVDCIHYCSSSQIAKNKKYINESPKKLLTVLCTPLGYMVTGYIHYKLKVDKRLTF